MKTSIIVAIAENHAIGKDNQLLWHLPADLKHFKVLTTGHPIIMGRKTYDSIGKPLPNRRNIVVTRQHGLEIDGVEVVNSLNDALSLCRDEMETFIIGGAEIYKSALDKTDRIYLTTVHATYEADAFFPALDLANWQEIEQEHHQADEKNAVAYTFSTLERKSTTSSRKI
ncbi:MAG: dihydrofolate reductase [Pedobacter sp.]|nr:dihydrofolate reductase [Pedobacter sp.]MDQ8053701.1 dihydrofolate reductase [Pedobacter sp.]